MLSKVYDGRPKNEQDTYLQSLIECQTEIKRRRPRKTQPDEVIKSREANFTFFVRKHSNKVPVCKKAFISLHGVSRKQVARLCKLLLIGKSPKDLRGRHLHRPNVLPNDCIAKIRSHIESFPVKTSHYKSGPQSYLDARLTVKTMHKLFVKKIPDWKIK